MQKTTPKEDNLYCLKLIPRLNASALKRKLEQYEKLYLIHAQHHDF